MAIQMQIRRLMTLFIVLFVVISGYLVYWQTYWPQAQAAQYNAYRQCVAGEQPVRGRIFDRNGVLLAWSEPDAKSPCGWRRRYATQANPASVWTGNQAVTAHPSISSFLGYFSYIYGSTGIEQYDDALLTGQSGGTDINASIQNFWNRTLHKPVHGQDLYLSIDVRLQDYIDDVKHFASPFHSGVCPDSSTGSIIVTDPRSGEILAMVSKPYFNGDMIGDTSQVTPTSPLTNGQKYWSQLNSDPNSPLLNRALQGQYPPGSSFKTLTLAAGIDSGQYTINSSFTKDEASTYTVNGHVFNSNNLADYPQGLSDSNFPLPLGHAYAYSDNVVFARVGVALGATTWLSYAQKFYMSTPDNLQTIPIDTFPAPRSQVYHSQFDQVQLAASAFGQGELFLSPLTMSMIDNAVAADGQLFAPHFLLKSVAPDTRNPVDVAKNDPNAAPTMLSQVFQSSTALQVRQAMRDVVQYGSVGASGGQIAAIYNLPMMIGGKTGTAQLPNGNPHAWFISLAPDNGYTGGGGARLTVSIMKENGGEGACQAPVAGDIYTYAMGTLGY